MLLDNFYTILSSESSDSTTWTIQIELNPDHTVYQGHFPEHPVVPGVCLLQLIKECAENIRQQKLQITQVSSCKFLSAINPIETPRIAIVLSLKETEEGKLQLQAEGTVKEKTVNKSIVKEDIAKEEIVKENTGKESIIKEENIKDECFIHRNCRFLPWKRSFPTVETTVSNTGNSSSPPGNWSLMHLINFRTHRK